MKLTAQADFYIEKFGAENGVKYLKDLGYQNIIYTITARTLEPFSKLQNECEIKNHFKLLRESLDDTGVNLVFTNYREEIYNDQIPSMLESKKQSCIQAVKATAYMGCKIMGVRPVCFRCSTPDAWEESKRLTYEIYSEVKKEADKLGVKLAFFNNTKQLCFSSGTYSYGCRASELLELAEYFESGVIINPAYALRAGERVEELLLETKDKLLGFCIDDKAQRTMSQGIPMFGAVDYYGLIDFFKTYQSDAAMVMMYTPIMNRYVDFIYDHDVVDTLTKAFMSVACLISGCDKPDFGKESLS